MNKLEQNEVIYLNMTEEFNLIKSLYKQNQITLAEFKMMLEELDNYLINDGEKDAKSLLLLINVELSEISTHH